jgi:hypothetical protein
MDLATAKLRVFDHARGDLLKFARKAGFTEVVTAENGEKGDEEAKDVLLRDPDWKLALVHMSDGPWKQLCAGVSAEHIVVRFSSEGFAPCPPEGVFGLCVRCLKKPTALKGKDIEALRDTLGVSLESLRKGGVPEALSELISFEKPHHLHALDTVLLGILAEWASDPRHSRRSEALKRLGGITIPPLPKHPFGERRTIWRILGLDVVVSDAKVEVKSAERLQISIARELGVSELRKRPVFSRVIEAIIDGPADEFLDETTVLDGFDAIEEFLKKR